MLAPPSAVVLVEVMMRRLMKRSAAAVVAAFSLVVLAGDLSLLAQRDYQGDLFWMADPSPAPGALWVAPPHRGWSPEGDPWSAATSFPPRVWGTCFGCASTWRRDASPTCAIGTLSPSVSGRCSTSRRRRRFRTASPPRSCFRPTSLLIRTVRGSAAGSFAASISLSTAGSTPTVRSPSRTCSTSTYPVRSARWLATVPSTWSTTTGV